MAKNAPEITAVMAQKTITAHRTTSSPGGGGINEVMFDDAAGSELFAMTGHYDINAVAGNNKSYQVKRNQRRTVGVDRTVKVGSNEKLTVERSSNAKAGGSISAKDSEKPLELPRLINDRVE